MPRECVRSVKLVRSVLGWMILIAGISGIAGQTATVIGQTTATSFTDAFDSQSDYALIGAGATKTDEPVDPTGNNAVKVWCPTGPTTIGLGRDLGEANKVDFRGMSFRARYYVDPQTQPNLTGNAVNIYFYNGVPNGTNYARIVLPYAPGWNTVEFSLTACISHGSFSWSNGVRFYSCSLNVPAGGSYIIWDVLEAWASGARKGAVIFTFDDGYLSEYQEGVLYLNQFGFRSMMYISPEMMGTGSGENAFCTWDQVALASAAGCLISTHCQSGTPTTSIEAQRDFYRGQKQALIDHGYAAGADYWAIPGGQVLWDDTYLTPNDYYATAKEFFVHIRGTQPYWQQAPDFLGNVTCQPRAPRDIHWGHPVATGTTGKEERNHYWVDKAIENKDVICFMTHRITASGTGAITIAAWRDLVDYVKAKVDAGELEVLTYQDLVGNVQDVPGDTDHDGDVDLVDLGNLAVGYGTTSGATWEQGDFDGDGDVDLVDLGTLAGNYGHGVPAPLDFAADAQRVGFTNPTGSTSMETADNQDPAPEKIPLLPGGVCSSIGAVLMVSMMLAFCLLGGGMTMRLPTTRMCVVLVFLCADFLASAISVAEVGQVVEEVDFANKKNLASASAPFLTYSRPSTAIRYNGTTAVGGELRTELVTVATPVEYTEVYGYQVMNMDQQYVYAKNGNTLYRSIGAGTPFEVVHTFYAEIQAVQITERGTLLVGLAVTTLPSGRIWRQDGNNVWSCVLTFETQSAFPRGFSCNELDGRLFFGEYGPVDTEDNARRVYMSEDDGLTWAKIHDPPNVSGRHLHQVLPCRVDGEMRVYLCYGDGASYGMYYLTEPNDDDDDSPLWNATQVNLPFAMQPTSGVWIPEQNAIIWGSDGSKPSGIIWHDLADDHMEFVKRMSSNKTDEFDSYTIRRCGSTYVAFVQQPSGDHKQSGIWVSKDGSHWARAVRYSMTSSLRLGGAGFGFGPDGKIWAGDAGKSIYFDAPDVITLEGALVERASHNLYDSSTHTPITKSAISVANETNDIWVGAWPGPVSKRVREKPEGTPVASIQFEYVTISRGVSGDSAIRIPDCHTGDVINVHMRIKGNFGDGAGNNLGLSRLRYAEVMVQVKDTANLQTDTKVMSVYPDENGWQQVTTTVTVTRNHTPGGHSVVQLYFRVPTGYDPYDAEFDILIDGVMIEKSISPAEWQPYGLDRAADVLSYTPTSFPAEVTDVFTVASRFGEFDMGAPSSGDGSSYIYLRSYKEDNDNFFAVVYDAADSKVKLVDETAGSNAVVATVAAGVYLFRNEAFTVGVTRSGTTVTLHVMAGGKYQTDSGIIGDHTIVTDYWGCHPDGGQGGSLVFVQSRMWDEAKSVADVQLAMQQAVSHPLSPLPGDTDHDGDVDLVDLGNLAAGYGLSSGATWEQGDFDGDGDVDLVDLGTLAGNYGHGVSAPLDFAADAAKLGLNDAKDATTDESGKESDLESLSPVPGASCIPTAIVLMTCLAGAFFWLGPHPGRKS